MKNPMQDRRTLLKILGSSAAAIPLLAQTAQAKVFSPAEMSLLSELTDRILPRTDTPGATDAGVPLLMDRRASQRPDFAARSKAMLAYFGAAGATPEARLAVLERLSKENADHFKFLKDTTIDFYYGTREGLVQELGWNGNTFVADFKGCTHPEHQS